MDEDDDDDCEIAEEEIEEGNGADGTVNEEHHQSEPIYTKIGS